MGNDSLADLDIAELRELLLTKAVSATEVVAGSLDRIERAQGALNAFVVWDRAAALSRARELDERLARGDGPGHLHGIPVAVKDNYLTVDLPTGAGSRVQHPAMQRRDADLVSSLRAAGAVVVGKTTMHEWAYGATNLVSASGRTANPWDGSRITGGSSGGSGAALAARLVPAALGSDTGGSIRIPAAACGVTGLKPTYGYLGTGGLLPLAWSFDVAGPMARSAADLRTVLQAVVPARPGQVRPVPAPRTSGARSGRGDGLRVGVLRGTGLEASDEVDAAVAAAVAELTLVGGYGHEVRIERVPEAFGAWKTILHCEAASYHLPVVDEAGETYAPDVRAQIEAGRAIPAVDYLQAQRFRREFVSAVLHELGDVDVLAMPTLPVCAPLADVDRIDLSGTAVTVQDAMTRLAFLANFTGLPAISVPCGFGSGGLPIGLTLMGRYREDEFLVSLAESYQERTGWHLQRPPLAA